MYAQNISIPPDYFGDWRSAVISPNESGHSWREDKELCPKGKFSMTNV